MDIAVSAEDQIAISCDAKRCIWKHAEAIGQGRMGQGELQGKGFCCDLLLLVKKMERAQYKCDADPRNTNCKG